mmetsp:Transcript_42046/g.65743  ORF Transcript_42046/g.65743 Transcript_42046/m.65743 type:complete len:721 (+) Transcript_42046:293-2455(+)
MLVDEGGVAHTRAWDWSVTPAAHEPSIQSHGSFSKGLKVIAESHRLNVWSQTALLEIYQNEELADVVLRAQDSELNWVDRRAHSVVLGMVSPVMRKMMNWERSRKSRAPTALQPDGSTSLVLELGEVDAAAVSAFLDFVYTGEAVVAGGIVQWVALGCLADRLDVQPLRKAVLDATRSSLTIGNCAQLLQACRNSGLPELEDCCIRYALQYFAEFARTPGFVDLDEDTVERLLVDDRLRAASEEMVYESLMLWMSFGAPQRRLSSLGINASDSGVSDPLIGEMEEDSDVLGCGKEEIVCLRSEKFLECIRFGFLNDEYINCRVLPDADRWECSRLRELGLAALATAPVHNVLHKRAGSGPDVSDLVKFHVRHAVQNHSGAVSALACYNGSVISGSRDGSIFRVNAETGTLEGILSLPGVVGQPVGQSELGAVHCFQVHGDVLFSGSQCKAHSPLHAWNLMTMEHMASLKGHTDAVLSLAAQQDHLYSGSWDGTIREWNIQDLTCTRILGNTDLVFSGPILSLTYCKDSLAIVGVNTPVQVMGLSASALPVSLDEGQDKVMSIVAGVGPRQDSSGFGSTFKPHGRLFTGHRRGEIRVWNAWTWKCAAKLKGHDNAVTALAVWGSWLISGSLDCTVQFWDLSEGDLEHAHVKDASRISDHGSKCECATCSKCECSICRPAKIVYVQAEVSSLQVADGRVICGCKDRSVRILSAESPWANVGG